MSLNSYTNLKTAITTFANTTKITDAVAADFIALAEAEMDRRIKTRRKYIRSEATVTDEFTPLPDAFDSPISIVIESTDPDVNLTYIDPEEALKLRSTVYTSSGVPVHYSIVGDEMQLIPAPDGSYTVEMTYRQKIEALSDDNSSNWVLEDHPDAYLYGSLIHAGPWLIDDPRLPAWGELFERAINGINAEDQVSNYGGKLNRRLARVF